MSERQGKPRLRISDVIAGARMEQDGFGQAYVPAPSLGSPSRPKTPANFDEPPSRNHQSNQITNLMAGAATRKAMKQQGIKPARSTVSKPPTTPVIENEPVRSSRSFAPTSMSYNTTLLMNDLSYLLENVKIYGKVNLDEDFTQEIEGFIKFLQPLSADSSLDAGLVNEIEEIIMKLSEIPITMLHSEGADPLQVLSMLRLNTRILVKLLETSALPTAPSSTSNTSNLPIGIFDLSLVSTVMEQCTNTLQQLCSAYNFTGEGGSASLMFVSLLASASEENTPRGDNNYENLDDADIEEENEDGTYVPVRPASSNSKHSTNAIAQTNGDLVGVSHLNALLALLWPRAQHIIKLLTANSHFGEFCAENVTILENLLGAVGNICGVYKYISADETDCRWLSDAAVLPLLVVGLKVFASSTTVQYINTTSTTYPSSTVYIDCVSQILSVVRNFSMVKSCQKELYTQSVVPILCALLGVYTAHSKVVVNCARVLAKLSLSEKFREQMNSRERHIQSMVNVVLREAAHSGGATTSSGEAVEWPGQHTWSILFRVCYTLGNLTTSNENNRTLIGSLGLTGVADRDKDDPLVDLLASCGMALSSMFGGGDDQDEEGDNSDGDGGSEDGGEEEGEADNDSRSAERELVDATVKLVRLLANLSMDANIGRMLGSKNANALEMLVKMLVSVREGTSASQEELLLNVIAACTNLTYYSSKYINDNVAPSTPGRPGRATVSDRLLDLSHQLATHLVTCLTTHRNTEIQLESARVLGNLTRIESVRRRLISTYGADLLVDLLKHEQWDVVTAVAGVMVNLSADSECKQELLACKALVPLYWLLHKVGLEDPELSTLICQALYNLLLHTPAADTAHVHNKLHATLKTLIDTGLEEAEDPSSNSEYKAALTQFLKVASAVQKLVVQQRAESS